MDPFERAEDEKWKGNFRHHIFETFLVYHPIHFYSIQTLKSTLHRSRLFSSRSLLGDPSGVGPSGFDIADASSFGSTMNLLCIFASDPKSPSTKNPPEGG